MNCYQDAKKLYAYQQSYYSLIWEKPSNIDCSWEQSDGDCTKVDEMAFADVIRPVADDWVKVLARSSKRANRRSGGDWGSLSE